MSTLRALRRLLSRSEFPPVDAALKAGAVPLLVQCLSFGSPDEQVETFSHDMVSFEFTTLYAIFLVQPKQ